MLNSVTSTSGRHSVASHIADTLRAQRVRHPCRRLTDRISKHTVHCISQTIDIDDNTSVRGTENGALFFPLMWGSFVCALKTCASVVRIAFHFYFHQYFLMRFKVMILIISPFFHNAGPGVYQARVMLDLEFYASTLITAATLK